MRYSLAWKDFFVRAVGAFFEAARKIYESTGRLIIMSYGFDNDKKLPEVPPAPPLPKLHDYTKKMVFKKSSSFARKRAKQSDERRMKREMDALENGDDNSGSSSGGSSGSDSEGDNDDENGVKKKEKGEEEKMEMGEKKNEEGAEKEEDNVKGDKKEEEEKNDEGSNESESSDEDDEDDDDSQEDRDDEEEEDEEEEKPIAERMKEFTRDSVLDSKESMEEYFSVYFDSWLEGCQELAGMPVGCDRNHRLRAGCVLLLTTLPMTSRSTRPVRGQQSI